ncbi:histone deacetylase complex subunit SAP18-like [Convolutriloba macropyga]|uniref:histone deacetylase complex subunit SAP18-like n=1 Tax=Convolutriloba macropyga TaxID=536237 RepID=UPI003F51E4AF
MSAALDTSGGAAEESGGVPGTGEKTVDREKTCPLLLRVFTSYHRHNRLDEFERGNTPPVELKIYTWMDATLKELSSLIKEVNHEARKRGTFFSFRVVYPDSRKPIYRMRDLGTTCTGKKGLDDNISLASAKFTIGDYIDVAISIPPGPGGGGGGPGRPDHRRGRPY